MEPSKQPWDRQPKESAKAYEARRLYLDLGPSRSVEEVRKRLGKSRVLMERWAARWKWTATARHFDSYNQSIAEKARVQVIVERERARAEKWAIRDEEWAEAMWAANSHALADLKKILEEEAASKRRVSYRIKAAVILNIRRMAPIARQACDLMLGRTPTAGPEPERDDRAGDGISAGRRAKAARQAFIDAEDGDPAE